MSRASSASLVCYAPASASEYTATARIPMARQVRMTRMAISPRLATRMDRMGRLMRAAKVTCARTSGLSRGVD